MLGYTVAEVPADWTGQAVPPNGDPGYRLVIMLVTDNAARADAATIAQTKEVLCDPASLWCAFSAALTQAHLDSICALATVRPPAGLQGPTRFCRVGPRTGAPRAGGRVSPRRGRR